MTFLFPISHFRVVPMAESPIGSGSVPVLSSLTGIYGCEVVQEQEARYARLEQRFRACYGTDPDFIVRAPGRVNLIGEHVDYSGFSVLPMAIHQDMVIAVGVSHDDEIHMTNIHPRFPPRTVSKTNPPIDASNPLWCNYFLAGYKGIMNVIEKEPRGLHVLIDGTVPPGSGLSSSSAFVCAAGLATVHAHAFPISQRDLAELVTVSERFVGTESGGMDQAISFLARPGVAMRIDFDPLTATEVVLPEGITFVIANSLVESNKAVTGPANYNRRVVECRLAAVLLAHHLRKEGTITQDCEISKVRILRDVKKLSGLSYRQLAAKVQEHLHTDPYSTEEVARDVGVEWSSLIDTVMVTKAGYRFDNRNDTFSCYQRALHVFSEAQRVFDFQEVCNRQSHPQQAENLGRLMNESHESCASLFECSCAELDELTSLCREAGALGSRLTGAGWGGCVVSLVPLGNVDNFLRTVTTKYYDPRRTRARTFFTLEEVLFASTPGSGAAVYAK